MKFNLNLSQSTDKTWAEWLEHRSVSSLTVHAAIKKISYSKVWPADFCAQKLISWFINCFIFQAFCLHFKPNTLVIKTERNVLRFMFPGMGMKECPLHFRTIKVHTPNCFHKDFKNICYAFKSTCIKDMNFLLSHLV